MDPRQKSFELLQCNFFKIDLDPYKNYNNLRIRKCDFASKIGLDMELNHENGKKYLASVS